MAEATGDIDQDVVDLVEQTLGYAILVDGEYAGAIEGVPGHLEYIEVDRHWEDSGVARAAVREFITLTRTHDVDEVRTTNTTHPAMTHILETEGFERRKRGKSG